MSLKEQVTEDMKQAMREKAAARLSTIRMLTAAIKQKEVDERITLTDADIVSIVEKMIKQRRESVSQFEAGARPDLADKEKAEIAILSAYMPPALDARDIEKAVAEAVAGATGPQDMGKVMGVLKAKLVGRADMSLVAGLVKKTLSG
ncbi:MAG: GatB/YqeY domain-containing protein [Burkholderiaceae bacterium]|jgi:uncharacterized protein YqeY|nr:GatB/YqeY domain-containing protein [Burkholderiaceae bacterium]